MFAWFMDEVVLRVLMLLPKRRQALRAHMDRVREQDIRLTGSVHPLNRKHWLKP